jgi:hypothetical protein
VGGDAHAGHGRPEAPQRRQRQLSPPDLTQGADADHTDNDACGNIGLG